MSTEVSGNASGLTEIVIVSLLGSLMAGILICSDFETKTIHDSVASGNGRFAIVISKSLVYILIIAILLLPYLAATIIAFCTGAKFASPFVASVFIGILSDTAGRGISVDTIGKMIIVSLTVILIHAARLSICIPFAFKIRKPVVILAIGFIFDAMIDLLIRALDGIPILSDVISFTPYYRDYLLLTMSTGAGVLLKAVLSCIIFMAIMTGLTYAIFRRDEIK
jgi:ABC-2 type transport system permease protein